MSATVINYFKTTSSTSTSPIYFCLPTSFLTPTSTINGESILTAEFTMSGMSSSQSTNVGVGKYLAHWRFNATGSLIDNDASTNYDLVELGGTTYWASLTTVQVSTLSLTTHRYIPVVQLNPTTTTTMNWVFKGSMWLTTSVIY